MTGALVGCAENCGVSAVAVVGRRPVIGQGRCARRCNDWGRAMLGSTVVTCSASSSVAFGRIFTTFLVSGRTRILRSIFVASSPCSLAEDEVAALVVNNASGMLFAGIAGISAPRAVFTTSAGMTTCTR